MSEIERIYQRGYEQGKSNAYSVILSTLKRVWEKYEADKEIECQLGTKTIIYNKSGKYVKVEYGYWNGWFILPREEFYEHVNDFSEWLEWYAKEE